MSNKPWGAPTSWEEVCRRKAGRDRYHAVRRVQREVRRIEVLKLLHKWGYVWGTQARIARELGVSPATVSRDVSAILNTHAPCPVCETVVERDRLAQG